MRIALLGDSIFDNKPYVGKGKSVIEHLWSLIPRTENAQLVAQDGAIINDVYEQLTRTINATHIVVSVGGNNVLGEQLILQRESPSIAHSMWTMRMVVEEFRLQYLELCRELSQLDLPIMVCTIYNPSHPKEQTITQEIHETALSLFNDQIHQCASLFQFPTLELRQVCTKPEHYANPIEPSHAGGFEIARAILNRTTEKRFSRVRLNKF